MLDIKEAHRFNKINLSKVVKAMARCKSGKDVEKYFDVYKQCLLYEAPVDFDSFMLYLEIDRPPGEKFYAPRRKKIKHLVDALQRLADDELDELFVSQPPRTGKTTVMMMYLLWEICRDPEKSNLYCAFSETITGAFYKGVCEILDDDYTYRLRDIFPDLVVADRNSQLHTLNIGRSKRYPSITARSLYGTLNGSCDANGLLISDDLIGGIEEALNKDRMMKAWVTVTNNMLSRAKQKCKLLWIGTRWSLIDPIGMRIATLEDDTFKNRRYEIINLPALDENDESLFDYDYDVGYSTQAFKEKRATFEKNDDMASWNAQYMGMPIEREGSLFSSGEMTYFNGELPDGEPDVTFMAIDPAFGGGDYVASPVCKKYGDVVYVVDTVFDNGDKTITQPNIVDKIIRWGVTRVQIEATKSTESYAQELDKMLRAKGYRINIMTKAAGTRMSKEQRIFDKAPEIRNNFIFLEGGKRSKEYHLFMQNVFSFTMVGKNKHDDAPDSLSMACDMAFNQSRKVEAVRRLW